MRRASIVCTLSCLLFAACGGAETPADIPDDVTDDGGAAPADSGSSGHHDASASASGTDGSMGDDTGDDDDEASVATDAGADATTPADASPGDGDASADATADGAADAAADAGAEAGKEAGPPDSGLPLGQCTGTFGKGLTNSYGRIDGILQAYVKPTATSCPDADSTHLILQIAMDGAIYEIAVNVLSDDDSDVLYTAIDQALPAPAYSEGWHTGVTLDYPTTLGVHSTQFTAYSESDLVDLIDAQLTDGAPITVYGHGFVTGAHDTHYYGGGADGAIVLDPTAATPHWLLFHFDEQTF